MRILRQSLGRGAEDLSRDEKGGISVSGGEERGSRTEELAGILEDFGLGDDEVVADDFEKLGLHGENVVVVE
jgi:hypothetical protein